MVHITTGDEISIYWHLEALPAIGGHYLQMLECGNAGTQWYMGGGATIEGGILGWVMG